MSEEYHCPCGKTTSYGIHYDIGVFWIGSCCDGGTGIGCAAALNIKYCPFCGKKLKAKEKTI